MLKGDNKLSLGTVQFGLDYGINNKNGKINKNEAFRILKFALNKKINMIDTAQSYGDSEIVIGRFIKENDCNLKIISKLSIAKTKNIDHSINNSISKLNVKKLYALLIHDFLSFKENKDSQQILNKLNKKKIEKIGFSLYYPEEVKYLLSKKIPFDIVQIPFSILDQRFMDILPLLKSKGIEVHVRSIFLQGIMFKKITELGKDFLNIKDKLNKLQLISKKNNIPIEALCINFATINSYIDKVIIGVDSLDNLKENITALKYRDQTYKIYDELIKLREDDEKIILPINWKK